MKPGQPNLTFGWRPPMWSVLMQPVWMAALRPDALQSVPAQVFQQPAQASQF
jgi:hypothetical protein